MADSIATAPGDSLWIEKYQAFWWGYGDVADIFGTFYVNGVEYATPTLAPKQPQHSGIAITRNLVGLRLQNTSTQVQKVRWLRVDGRTQEHISLQPGEQRMLTNFPLRDLLIQE